MIALTGVWIAQRQALETAFSLAEVLLAEDLQVMAANRRGNCLDEKGWLKEAFVSNLDRVGGDQVADAKNFVCGGCFALFFLNYAAGPVAFTFWNAFQGEVVKDAGSEVLLPPAVGATAQLVQLLPKRIPDFWNIALSEPLLFLVLLDKGLRHLGLEILLVGVISGLDLGLFLFSFFLGLARPPDALRFAASAHSQPFLLFLYLFIGPPPLPKVGEADLIGQFERVRNGIGERLGGCGILARHITIDVGRWGTNAARAVVAIPGTSILIAATSPGLVTIDCDGRPRSASATVRTYRGKTCKRRRPYEGISNSREER